LGFREELELDPISNLELRDAIVARRYTLVRAAVAVMRARSLGCAVIVDDELKPIGLFTEQSVLEVLMQDACLDQRAVWDFAERDFVCCKSSEPISRVWDAVLRNSVRFIAVTNEQGKLIGLTGQRGLAEYISECFPRQTIVQRLGSTPWLQQREGA
jgi:CBS domain-containing protein